MIDDPLGTKTLASIDSAYFRSLLPKTVAGRSALDAAASEIEREIASVEAQQQKLLQQSIAPSKRSTRSLQPGKDGTDPLAYLTGSSPNPAANPWDSLRKTISGYDQLAFSEQNRLYDEFVKQEAVRTGQEESAVKLATASTKPIAPTRNGADLVVDVLAGLGAGTAGMGKTVVDLVAPDSRASKSLGERIDTLNSMQSPVEQNARKEAAIDVERFKQANPDAGALDTFLAEAKATGGNLSVGQVANLTGSMATGMGAAGKVAKSVAAVRTAAGASKIASTAAGAAAGTATGAGIEGVSTAGEVRGDVYQQVVATPLTDPNLQANEDFQKYLVIERGDVDPNNPARSPLDEYSAQRRARERLALDSKGAATAAGLASAALTVLGPEAVFAKAAARRAAAEAGGDIVGAATRTLSKLDNSLVRLPVTAAAEGVAEGAPTIATNINMQGIDPSRGVLEGAGGDVVLGMLGGTGGEGASALVERATKAGVNTAPTPAGGSAPEELSAAPEVGERIITFATPDGPSYSVRQFDDSVVEIPAGPGAQQQATDLAQQANDEAEGFTQPENAAPTEVELFGTRVIMQPNGVIEYAQNAPRTAEADQFLAQQPGYETPTAPATETPAPTGLSQAEAEALSQQRYGTEITDDMRSDPRLEGSESEVMGHVANGDFSPELGLLLQDLSAANWLGFNTPSGALEAALSSDPAATALPADVEETLTTLREKIRNQAATSVDQEGVHQEIQQQVGAVPTLTDAIQTKAPRTQPAAQPLVVQRPSVPTDELTLPGRAASQLANSTRDLARNPLPAITAIAGNPTLQERKDFFTTTLQNLLAPVGTTVEPGVLLTTVRTPGGNVGVSFVPAGGRAKIKVNALGLKSGSASGGAFYSALNAAAAAAGLPLYNDVLTSVNSSRLPINRMKALLQTAGASNIPLDRIAKLLALSPSRLGSRLPAINDFNSFARTVIKQAEAHFPSATASDMVERPAGGNFMSGVLRLNPDGTFDTPAGVMTPAQLMQWTRVNTSGEPRYRAAIGARAATSAFGASSYSSMALAGLLRSYMEATTPAQRAAIVESARRVSTLGRVDAEGNESRPFAFLDARRGAANPSESTQAKAKQVRVEAALKRLQRQFQASKITSDQFVEATVPLVAGMENQRNQRNWEVAGKDKVRGFRRIRSRLDIAVEQGKVSAEAADAMLWLLDQNPSLADDLGISIKSADKAGEYLKIPRIIQLFANAQDGTGVHELLHHTERMMPEVVRAGIHKAYTTALKKTMKNATPAEQKGLAGMINAVVRRDAEGLQKLFDNGTLDYDKHYQFANPSEFWAVNATSLLMKRRGETQTGWKAKAKKWLSNLAQKMKSLLGLPNDSAVLKGIEAVLKADGTFQTTQMLAESDSGDPAPKYLDIPVTNNSTLPPSGDQQAPSQRETFDQSQQRITSGEAVPAASPGRSLGQALNPTVVTKKGQARTALDAQVQRLNEAFHDHLAPVERLFANIGDASPELQRLGESAIGAMRAAPGVRDEIMRQTIEDHGGQQLLSTIEQISREQKLTLETASDFVGKWLTSQWVPIANARLLAQDAQEVQRINRLRAQAEQALNAARDDVDTSPETLAQLEAELVDASGQLGKATKKLANRSMAVNNTNAGGVKRHVAGVAGLNNAQAALQAANVEQRIPKAMLQQVAESIYGLNAFRLVTDLESGRASPSTMAQFLGKPEIEPLLQQLVAASDTEAASETEQTDRAALREQVMAAVRSKYVPLTGNPETALFEDVTKGNASQPNTGRTYALEGRQDSIPDDGLTTTLAGLTRSASYAGWAPFQDAVSAVYDKLTPAQRDDFGIHRDAKPVTDRTTGNRRDALVRLRGGKEQLFTFTDPKILQAIHNETIADTDIALGGFGKLTRLFAWANTRFNLAFAPRNTVRDFGERADLLLSKELRDAQGNKVPSPQVIKTMLGYGTKGLPKVLTAGARFVLNGTAGGNSKESRYLKELQESGSLSTYGQKFHNSRVDFVKQLKSAKTANRRLHALNKFTLELWNTPFDIAAPLASYIAMRENGVAKTQAQAITLDMMNFRKRGTQMKTLGAAYPFAQTAVTGGANMARSLVDLRTGKVKPYAVARLAGYTLTLAALRAMLMAAADDDEGGNKLAQLPDYEHENNIVIPFDNGVVKVPLPFGLLRLANGIVNNSLSYAGNEKTGGEAVGDLLMGTLVPSFAPLSESPLDGSKHPIEKFLLTMVPPIIKPLAQVASGLTAFGAPLKNEYAKDDKFISDQPKINTPAAYTTVAQTIRQWTGADMSPEAIQELMKGYSLGMAKYARTGLLENKPLAEELRKPFYAPYPDAARYFQFSEALDSADTERKKLNAGDTSFDAAKVKWFQEYEKKNDVIQGKLSSNTKSKGLSDAVKEERKAKLRGERSALQNEMLYKYRTEILKAEAKRTK